MEGPGVGYFRLDGSCRGPVLQLHSSHKLKEPLVALSSPSTASPHNRGNDPQDIPISVSSSPRRVRGFLSNLPWK